MKKYVSYLGYFSVSFEKKYALFWDFCSKKLNCGFFFFTRFTFEKTNTTKQLFSSLFKIPNIKM